MLMMKKSAVPSNSKGRAWRQQAAKRLKTGVCHLSPFYAGGHQADPVGHARVAGSVQGLS